VLTELGVGFAQAMAAAVEIKSFIGANDLEGESLRAEEKIKLLVFDKDTEEIVLWKR
jgi:hypothetical protein